MPKRIRNKLATETPPLKKVKIDSNTFVISLLNNLVKQPKDIIEWKKEADGLKNNSMKAGLNNFIDISDDVTNKLSVVEKQQTHLVTKEILRLKEQGTIKGVLFQDKLSKKYGPTTLGVYDHDERRIRVKVDKDNISDPRIFRTLAHEGIHAIELNRIDLNTKVRPTLDKVNSDITSTEWYDDIQRILGNRKFALGYPSGEEPVLPIKTAVKEHSKGWMINNVNEGRYNQIFSEIATHSMESLGNEFNAQNISNQNAGRKVLKKVLKELQNDFVDNVDGFEGRGGGKYSSLEQAFNNRIFQLKREDKADIKTGQNLPLNTAKEYFDYRQRRKDQKLGQSSIMPVGPYTVSMNTSGTPPSVFDHFVPTSPPKNRRHNNLIGGVDGSIQQTHTYSHKGHPRSPKSAEDKTNYTHEGPSGGE